MSAVAVEPDRVARLDQMFPPLDDATEAAPIQASLKRRVSSKLLTRSLAEKCSLIANQAEEIDYVDPLKIKVGAETLERWIEDTRTAQQVLRKMLVALTAAAHSMEDAP